VLGHIGNAGIEASTWAERTINSFRPQATPGKSPEDFTQIHPQQLPHSRLVNRDSGMATVSLKRDHSYAATVLPAPAQNRTLNKNQKGRKERVKANEPLTGKEFALEKPESISRINTREIADRVYRLMQHDLILEKDRTTKLGG
jgi:hypothetical protein